VGAGGDIVGPGNYENVGKSLSALITIDPIISPPHPHVICDRTQARAGVGLRGALAAGRWRRGSHHRGGWRPGESKTAT
jgi:hypothetical protein